MGTESERESDRERERQRETDYKYELHCVSLTQHMQSVSALSKALKWVRPRLNSLQIYYIISRPLRRPYRHLRLYSVSTRCSRIYFMKCTNMIILHKSIKSVQATYLNKRIHFLEIATQRVKFDQVNKGRFTSF